MKDNIAFIAEDHSCAGCGSCAAVCPKGAVTLRESGAGFYEALVEADKCIRCGQCLQVCPQISGERGRPLQEGTLLAVQSAAPEVVQSCSSGGIAHELSLAFLRAGGKVGGAVYDLDTHRVRHELISSADALKRLDGSKYLQSDASGVIQEVLRTAVSDREARFLLFGTPCQIAGLAAAAEKRGVREQLLLVELFCHGVPSYRVWDATVEHVSAKLKTARWDRVRFRYKKDDWHSYCLRIDADGRTYYGKRETELFWQVFFENILLNDACWSCRARRDRSLADIRLGDYWGARFMERSDGVSAAFAVTQRGGEAIRALLESGRLRTFAAGTPEEMLLAQNMAGYQQVELHRKAMAQLRSGADVRDVVRQYRRELAPKQRAKIVLLRLSAALPDGVRAKLRKKVHKMEKS